MNQKPLADLHIHTVSSGHAFSTIEEIVRAAKAIGLEMIAITDHGPALPGGAHPYHFWNLRVLPDYIDGVRILKGAEANIINNKGEVDIAEELLAGLDVVILAFHTVCGYRGKTVEENTQTMLKAMENPHVNIIAHPGNPMYHLDCLTIAKAAKEKNILIEFNNSSYLPSTSRDGARELDRKTARAVKEVGNKIILSSDAHLSSCVGNFSAALKLLEEENVSQDQIMNYDVDKLLRFLGRGEVFSPK